ncbi:MAG: hypothetical protein HY910_01580 [Desulfarculus sp.]|nr:hypothetical protein [Desulfarculus sp.]
MNKYCQSFTASGRVTAVDPVKAQFTLERRSKDALIIRVGVNTSFGVVMNLDNLNRDRVPDPVSPDPTLAGPSWQVLKYIRPGDYLMVGGIEQEDGDIRVYEARSVTLAHAEKGQFAFEDTHWWIDQISQMADQWLDNLFGSTREYKIDDFSKLYRTSLSITGEPTDDTIQECATLSRLIYGLSSAYLMTGSDRYLMAARAGVQYQREAFRSISHDGEYCFWAFGRRAGVGGSKLVIPSENDDDRNTIPLYEQIYALAGLAQYYRITQEWEVLEDIRRTVKAFLQFYHDTAENKDRGYPGLGGYFSHLDYSTMRPDTPALAHNQSRKNWNSVGDHIPAYLINVILALDPVAKKLGKRDFSKFLKVCRDILFETSQLIVDKFPDQTNYVNERFFADFSPDHGWRWQQNRAICGHNLKIAWNLTRVAFYYQGLAASSLNGKEKKIYGDHAAKCQELAKTIGLKMATYGLDMARGGIFDAVERVPSNGMPIEFAWGSTKDFWQQEQGMLAYLILHGADPDNKLWLELARESEMFWNCFFLDRDRRGYFFRTTESGDPVIQGSYGQKSGHSTCAYHAFELCYLAHVYTRSFVVSDNASFCMHFNITPGSEFSSLNVLPDFMTPGMVTISCIRVNGVNRTDELKPDDGVFQLDLSGVMTPESQTEVQVTFNAVRP